MGSKDLTPVKPFVLSADEHVMKVLMDHYHFVPRTFELPVFVP